LASLHGSLSLSLRVWKVNRSRRALHHLGPDG
jgi:hypothetical protein